METNEIMISEETENVQEGKVLLATLQDLGFGISALSNSEQDSCF